MSCSRLHSRHGLASGDDQLPPGRERIGLIEAVSGGDRLPAQAEPFRERGQRFTRLHHTGEIVPLKAVAAVLWFASQRTAWPTYRSCPWRWFVVASSQSGWCLQPDRQMPWRVF